MTQKNVIACSFSDCREKNGVITFMEILKKNTLFFGEHGWDLDFANYVDFPKQAVNSSSQTQGKIFRPKQQTKESSLLLVVGSYSFRIKRCVKPYLTRRPIGSFVLLFLTLGFRGLVTAWKARQFETNSSIYFYQDVFTAFFGHFLHGRESKKILILHTSENPLYQVFDQFRSLIDTPYEIWIRKAFLKTLKSQDAIVTLSENLATELRSEHPSLNIRCIYNTSPFSNPDSVIPASKRASNRFEIVAVGSLIYRKGFDLLIDALGGMANPDRQQLHLTIVGDGIERLNLQKSIEKYNLSEVVTLSGEASDVSPFLLKANAFILPSRDEGLPIALIEATCFGLPIISTRVGSVPEIFNDTSCVFIEGNTQSIRQALSDVVQGKVDLVEISRKSQEVYKAKLSPESFLTSYLKLFTDILAQKRLMNI